MPRSSPSHTSIVLDANQENSATTVSEANNRFDEITIIQPLTPLAFELDGVALTGSDPTSYPTKQTLRGLPGIDTSGPSSSYALGSQIGPSVA